MPLFSTDPATRDNEVAAQVRDWYEDHRESFFDRWGGPPSPDEFMLALVREVLRVTELAKPLPAPQAAVPVKKSKGKR